MQVCFADCELDLERHELHRAGTLVEAGPRVFDVLAYLVEHRDRMVPKTELLDEIWGDHFVSEAALSTQIRSVRQAVGDTGRDQQIIKTVHGRGFRFVAEVRTGEPPTPPAASDKPSIAVLPFDSLSTDPEQAYVADGITDDIITLLSKYRWLNVSARNSVIRYKGESPDPRRVADELGSDYLVTGSVRRSGRRLRVTVHLVDTATAGNVWAQHYDRDIEDLFEIQDDILTIVVASIEPEVGAAERQKVARKPRTNLRAWDCYHLGISHFFRFTDADNLEAQRLLDASRELDPDFGEAHAWWAYAVILGMVYWNTEPTPALLDEALAAAKRALELDDQNAVFYMLKGRVQLARREYESALTENETAIELNPSFAAAYCGLGDSLCYEGRYEEAVEQFERSVTLGSSDPQRWAFLSYGALALLFDGKYETALEWAERARSVPNCQYWTLAHKVVALAHLRRKDDAARAVVELLADQPHFTIAHARRKLFYLKRPEQVERYLEGLRVAGVPEA